MDYPPSLNRYWRQWQGRTLLSREARSYKQTSALQALQQGVKVQEGPLCVSLNIFRPQRRGDIDNVAKGLLDSLNGIAWTDDSQIVEMHLFRNDDKNDPRIEVNVESRA